MRVAKYWRNKKLRYRMIRLTDQSANGRATEDAARRDEYRIQEAHDKRVRVVS